MSCAVVWDGKWNEAGAGEWGGVNVLLLVVGMSRGRGKKVPATYGLRVGPLVTDEMMQLLAHENCEDEWRLKREDEKMTDREAITRLKTMPVD